MRKKVATLQLGLFLALCALALQWHGSCREVGEEGAAADSVRADRILFSGEGAEGVMRDHAPLGHLWSQLLGNRHPDGAVELLSRFAADSTIVRLQDSVEHYYPDTESLDRAFGQAFSRMRAALPGVVVPQVYYINGGFNASVLVGDSLLAIGLDRFLGAHCPYYEWLGVPNYMSRWMHAERIVPQALEAWLSTEYPSAPDAVTVLERMVARGKLRYCLRTLLPEDPDSIVLGYTARELRWFSDNEHAVWVHMTDHKLLFNREALTVSQLAEPGPFTNFYGQDSPGEVGGWIGYRIVSEYMRRNPKVSMGELLSQGDAQAILFGAKYKP